MNDFKFPPKRNYGLCDLKFNEKPYCNQMAVFFNETHRFCDVCKRNWRFINGYIVETTRTEYKISDLEIGSEWMLDGPVEILKIKGDQIKLKTEKNEIYDTHFSLIGKNLMRIIRKLTEEDIMNYTSDEKIWRER